jgi:hypothetical protein
MCVYKTPEALLKPVFLYLTEGQSVGNTSALLPMSEDYRLTKQAILPGCVTALPDSEGPPAEAAVRESVPG